MSARVTAKQRDAARHALRDDETLRLCQRLALKHTSWINSGGGRNGLCREDVAQAVMTGLWLRTASWDPSRGASLVTYLGNCAGHLVVDALRALGRSEKQRTERALPHADVCAQDREDNHEHEYNAPSRFGSVVVPSRETDPAAALEQVDAVRQLLSSFPARTAKLLRMLADGYTLKEAGTELGISESRACQLRNDARRYATGVTASIDEDPVPGFTGRLARLRALRRKRRRRRKQSGRRGGCAAA